MAGAIKINERFAKTCQVVFHNNYDTCGTITRSSIDYLTPSQLESLFTSGGLFADLDAWFKTSIEMKACGTKTNGMYDWIMSGSDRGRMKNLLTTQKRQKNPSLLFPFILGLQDSVINTDFWAISTGGAQSAYTASVTGPLTAGDLALGAATDRYIRVISRYGVEMDARWFRDRDRIFILGRSSIGIAERGQWVVLASAAAADGTYVDVLLKSENAGSTQAYSSAPTSGVVLIGVNNVNDYEKWCQNRANFDGKKEVPFWWQTMRRSRCVDSNYREFYSRLMTSGVNNAFARFGDLTLAERNAQDEANFQRHFVNAFFYQKAISANQTLANWKNLDTIYTGQRLVNTAPTASDFSVDPGNVGAVIAKRANFIGVIEQLLACDRVRDLQGNSLNFYEWLDENYRLKRARESYTGGTVTDIDWYTDDVEAANIITAYTAYLKNEYGSTNVSFPIDITKTMSNQFGFAWRTLQVKFPAGLNINIVTHPFFNDLRDAAKAEGMEERGINLWALDWSTIYWAQLASNRKVHTVGELEPLARIDKDWACVMDSITQEITLTSETGAVVISCPSNSTVIYNFRDGVPITTGKSSTSGGSYSDLLSYGV